MKEIGEESRKHMCKFCNKSFPCGRSLGGHMRSHVINSTDHHHVRNESCLSVLDKLCKECGKGFQSWKALFGHMKCHSIKLSSKKIASLNQDSCASHSDDENLDSKNRRIKRSRSRSRNSRNKSDQEVAMSLIMLSRDLGKCGKDSIRNHSKMNKFAETEVGLEFVGKSEVGLIKINEFDSNLGEFEESNKRKLECVTSNNSFHPHESLCGSKASHQKVLKRDFDAKIGNENKIKHKPVLDHDQTIGGCDSGTSNDHQESSSFNLDVGSLKKKSVVLRAHECPICLKVFKSGQALGGHKRSHLVCRARGFLDLNMLPEEEEEVNMSRSTTEYKSYCWEDSGDTTAMNQENFVCFQQADSSS